MKIDEKTAVSVENTTKKSGPVFTDEQRDAIRADGEVLVSASAGSGKTTTMVKKILVAMESGVPLSQMLVLVYNEAAASELKDRLQSALYEAACASDGAARKMFRDSLDGLSSARISTIHAFCRALIKENFEKIGVSPSFDVLSDGEEKRYESEAMDAVFRRCYDEGDETFMQLADVLTSARREDLLRKVVDRIRSVIAIQPDRAEFTRKVRESFGGADGGEYAEAAVRLIRRDAARLRGGMELVIPEFAAGGQTSYVDKLTRMCEICRAAECADLHGVTAAAVAAKEVASMRAQKKRNSEFDETLLSYGKDLLGRAADMFGGWRDVFADADAAKERHAQNAAFACKLIELAERTEEELALAKRADDVMSYSDLEYYAAELVRGGEFRGRFSQVFVDEYQDVNPVQDFIIRSVSGDNVFMVGDVKQSIYGFRLSDPEIFLARKRRYESGEKGTSLEFNANFRSVNAVLEFVNSVFDDIMTEPSCGVNYAEEGHFRIGKDKKNAADEPLEGGVEVHVFPYAGQSKSPGVYATARFIAAKIRELCASARTEEGRPVRYGDCAVLIRSRSGSAEKLAEYLAAEGLPVDAGTFADKSTRGERQLIDFLTVLDNPRQDIPLASFMLSPFCCFDESELARIAALRPEEGDFYDAVLAAAKEDTAVGKKTARMLEMLDSYRLKASFKSVPELLQSIVSDFDYDALVAGTEEGTAENVMSFVTAHAGKESYEGIGKFLAAYAERSDETGKARPAGGDKVRIATYHSYKGLESPVVFVVNFGPGKGGGGDSGDVIIENKGHIGLRFFDFTGRKKCDTLSLYAVKRMREERERQEEMRLYYVALTRAKQYLYITGTLSKTPTAMYGRYPCVKEPSDLMQYFSDLQYRGRIHTVMHETAEEAPGTTQSRTFPSLGEANEEDVAAIREAADFVYPYREATELAMKYSVSALDGGGDELTLGVFADRADEGIVYHKIMEHIDFRAEGRAGVEAEMDAMVAEGILTAEERAQADAAAIAECLASPVMQTARKSTCYREKSFLMYVPANRVGGGGSGDKVLVQGVIDLLIDGDERIIVDFKNSYLRSAEALEKYKKQLNLYKKAVESSFLGKVDKILLYSFKTGRTVELEKDDD